MIRLSSLLADFRLLLPRSQPLLLHFNPRTSSVSLTRALQSLFRWRLGLTALNKRTRCPHTSMQSLAVVEAFFDGMREALHGSGHAAVDVDRVADNVDATFNAESKYYSWPHEVYLFHAAYDGTLRVVGKVRREHGFSEVKGGIGKRGEGKRRIIASYLDLVTRRWQMAEQLLPLFETIVLPVGDLELVPV